MLKVLVYPKSCWKVFVGSDMVRFALRKKIPVLKCVLMNGPEGPVWGKITN